MKLHHDSYEELCEVVEELAQETLMLEMYLHCQHSEAHCFSQFSREIRENLLCRVSDYMTQHALDLTRLVSFFEV